MIRQKGLLCLREMTRVPGSLPAAVARPLAEVVKGGPAALRRNEPLGGIDAFQSSILIENEGDPGRP